MPRRKPGEMTQQTGATTGQRRSRKKKEPANPASDIKLEMQQTGMYDPQGMTNGMMIEECTMYSQDFYYQHGGPTSTASGSMNNGYGPSSQSQGPPGSAQPMNQSYPDAENIQPSQPLPPYNMTPGPMSAHPQPNMIPQHPGPPIHPPGPPNTVNPGMPQAQYMMRPMPLPFPQPPLLEYRLMEMNRRIYSFNHQDVMIQPQDKMQWWDIFGQEFFDDEARFTVIIPETPEISRRFSLCRVFIPKFFRHLFETGLTELYFAPRIMTTERANQYGTCAIECDQVTMFTATESPIPARAETEAKLFIEFSPYEEVYGYRIRQFYLELKASKEYISQQVVLDNDVQEKIKQGLTRCGLTNRALMFMKLCVIMEPMQVIIQQCKANPTMNPRDALRNVLFAGHKQQEKASQQRMMPPGMPPPPPMGPPMTIPTPQTVMPPQPPVEEPKKPVRKRTRKPNNSAGNATTPAKQRKGNSRASPAQATNNFPMNQNYSMGQYQEVLVVGEPSLMGGDFGEGDERSISRIENTQFDGSMVHGTGGIAGSAPMSMGGLPNNGSTPMYSRQNSFNRGVEVKMQPQSVPISRASSQSHLAMLQPPPPYDNSQWNVMNQSNTTLIAQPICDQ
uniref:LIM interaction domain-containing protein n=1 Tax=Panagrolaimus sp. JU765 TaxID=591449 RepID=A0AC34Q5D9_9BILA